MRKRDKELTGRKTALSGYRLEKAGFQMFLSYHKPVAA